MTSTKSNRRAAALQMMFVTGFTVLLGTSTASARQIGAKFVEANDPASRSSVYVIHDGAKAGQYYVCSGTLIASDLVATAAHCIDPLRASRVIFARDFELSVDLFDRATPADAATIPKTFDLEKVVRDVAVIHLKKNAPSSYTPVPRVGGDYTLKEGQTLQFNSYGATGNAAYDQGYRHQLQVGMFDVISDGETDTEMFTRAIETRRLEHGDSGGSVYVKGATEGSLVLVGVITSGGEFDNGSEKFLINGFTRLDTPVMQSWMTGAIVRVRDAKMAEDAGDLGSITYRY